jgi:hypothetical protein
MTVQIYNSITRSGIIPASIVVITLNRVWIHVVVSAYIVVREVIAVPIVERLAVVLCHPHTRRTE